MFTLTKEQQRAVQRRYDLMPKPQIVLGKDKLTRVGSYLDFRRSVQPTFGCDGAVTVYWCGMWLCIERDGYTHS